MSFCEAVIFSDFEDLILCLLFKMSLVSLLHKTFHLVKQNGVFLDKFDHSAICSSTSRILRAISTVASVLFPFSSRQDQTRLSPSPFISHFPLFISFPYFECVSLLCSDSFEWNQSRQRNPRCLFFVLSCLVRSATMSS